MKSTRTPVSTKNTVTDEVYGVLVKEKHKCIKCDKYGKIGTRYNNSIYAVFTSREGYVCRYHAKEARVI